MKPMIFWVSDDLRTKIKELASDNYTNMSEIIRKSILTSIDKNIFVRLPEKRQKLNTYEWSDAVKERDNYKCLHCGVQGIKKTVKAHHILPKKKGGRNVLENGITLCQSCHLKIHIKTK